MMLSLPLASQYMFPNGRPKTIMELAQERAMAQATGSPQSIMPPQDPNAAYVPPPTQAPMPPPTQAPMPPPTNAAPQGVTANRRDAAGVASNLPNIDSILPALPAYEPASSIERVFKKRTLGELFSDGSDYEVEQLMKRGQYEQIRQQVLKGNYQEIGNGVMYDLKTGQPLPIADSAIDLYKRIRGVAAGADNQNKYEYMSPMRDMETGSHYMYGIGPQGPGFYNAMDGNKLTDPDVAKRLSPLTVDSKFATMGRKSLEEYSTTMRDNAGEAQQSLTTFANLRDAYAGAQATGFGGDIARWIAEATGQEEILGIDLSSKQAYERNSKRLEAVLTRTFFKGQGAVTENERAIIQKMIPSLRDDPKVFEQIMAVYENASQRILLENDALVAYRYRAGDSASMEDFQYNLTRARKLGTPESLDMFNAWATEGVRVNWNQFGKPAGNTGNTTPPPAKPSTPGVRDENGTPMYRIKPSGQGASAPALPTPPPVGPTQFGGQGGPEQRFVGLPDLADEASLGSTPVRPRPQGYGGQPPLLDTPSSQLVEASRNTPRGAEYNRSAQNASQIGRIMRAWSKMSPKEREQATRWLRSVGVSKVPQ